MNLLTKLFGSYSKKELKRIEPLKQAVLALDDKYTKMTDEELKGQTAVLKERLSLGSSLDDILPEAFATCREAMWRVLSIKPFPVQIIGGIMLHQGRIAEMKTGEGKTFTAALPAYLNALSGKGVHIVTVNDYLAKYQGEMMARVFNYLGLTVGLAIPGMEPDEKKKAYACDITYATNNEIGFDYLRDNMVTYKERKVQRGHNFATPAFSVSNVAALPEFRNSAKAVKSACEAISHGSPCVPVPPLKDGASAANTPIGTQKIIMQIAKAMPNIRFFI